LSAAWRRWPVGLKGNVALARTEPSRHDRRSDAAASGAFDTEVSAATASLDWERLRGLDRIALRAGASAGGVRHLADGNRRERLLAFADARLTNTMARDTRVFSQSLAAFGVSGRTGDDDWTRGTVAARLHAGVKSLAIGIEGVA